MAGKLTRSAVGSPRSGTRGVSLIEAIVAGMIGLVIAGVVYSMFVVHNSTLSESAARARMQVQYENVCQAIAADTRRASCVVQVGENAPNPAHASAPAATSIRMLDAGGAELRRYVIAGDTLRMDGGVFEAGGGGVRLQGAQSWFSLPPFRTSVALHLVLETAVGDSVYRTRPRRDAYACRN